MKPVTQFLAARIFVGWHIILVFVLFLTGEREEVVGRGDGERQREKERGEKKDRKNKTRRSSV